MASLTPGPSTREARKSKPRGNALVEFALVLPMLLLVFAGIIDFGFLFQRHEVLTNAVREGARIAVLPAAYGAGVIQQRVVDYVASSLGSSSGLSVDVPVRSSPSGYQVVTVSARLEYSYLILGPVVSLVRGTWGNSITLTAASSMRTEVQP